MANKPLGDRDITLAREALIEEGVLAPGPNADPRSLLDTENPRSVINLAPDQVKLAILRTPLDFINMEEEELVPLAFPRVQRKQGHTRIAPSATDCRLRSAFWLEYERCQENVTKMSMRHIYSGVCSQSYFIQNWLRSKYKVAWLLKPPADYRMALEELLMYGLEEMREIMTLPVVNEATGRVDSKLADIKFKIWQAVEMRLKGAIIQKIRSENLNVNFNNDGSAPPTSAAEDDVSILDQKIAELEGTLHKTLPPAIEQLQVLAPEVVKEVVELENKS